MESVRFWHEISPCDWFSTGVSNQDISLSLFHTNMSLKNKNIKAPRKSLAGPPFLDVQSSQVETANQSSVDVWIVRRTGKRRRPGTVSLSCVGLLRERQLEIWGTSLKFGGWWRNNLGLGRSGDTLWRTPDRGSPLTTDTVFWVVQDVQEDFP